jgi:hypothetical protein
MYSSPPDLVNKTLKSFFIGFADFSVIANHFVQTSIRIQRVMLTITIDMFGFCFTLKHLDSGLIGTE